MRRENVVYWNDGHISHCTGCWSLRYKTSSCREDHTLNISLYYSSCLRPWILFVKSVFLTLFCFHHKLSRPSIDIIILRQFLRTSSRGVGLLHQTSRPDMCENGDIELIDEWNWQTWQLPVIHITPALFSQPKHSLMHFSFQGFITRKEVGKLLTFDIWNIETRDICIVWTFRNLLLLRHHKLSLYSDIDDQILLV